MLPSPLTTPHSQAGRFRRNRRHSRHEHLGNRCRSQRGWQPEAALAAAGMAEAGTSAYRAFGAEWHVAQAQACDPHSHPGDAGEACGGF